VSLIHLILREIRFRKGNFFLALAALSAGICLFVAFFTSGEAANRETIRLMRGMGFNLRLIPEKTDMAKFWVNGFSEFTLPEHYVTDLGSHQGISFNHLTATLQKGMAWNGLDIILTGMAPEVNPPGKAKSPMSFAIPQGTVYVGFEPARKLDIRKGETIDIGGTSFTVAKTLQETGSQDDIRIYLDLKDAQAVLGLPGRINEIKALQCLCSGEYSPKDALKELRAQLARLLPGTRVILMQAIANARQQQRDMTEKYFNFILPLAALVVIAWIGILAYLNVKERNREIGILRALGFGSGRISMLFLGRGIALGIPGACIGYAAGFFLAKIMGPRIFKVTAAVIHPSAALFIWALAGSLVAAAVSVFIPSMAAVAQDPAETLQKE